MTVFAGVAPFTHVALPQRVRFGTGMAAENLEAEVRERGARAVMVIASESEAELARNVVGAVRTAVIHSDVAPHVPNATADRARLVARKHKVDLIVSIGGGSTTGLAKAVALTANQPIVAVPTTYAGSEATNVWGITTGRTKTTGVDDRVLPKTVIYDAALFLTLPPDLVVASGFNALAHSIDSLWAPRADPINRALSYESAATIAKGLRALKDSPQDVRAHELCVHGAYLSAVAFASAGSGLHHKICHVLGGRYHLPHAQTHAIVLPYVLALNAAHVPEVAARLATALGGRADVNAVAALELLRADVGAPRALRDIGLGAHDIAPAVEAILADIPPNNPGPITAEHLRHLLEAALIGAASTEVENR